MCVPKRGRMENLGTFINKNFNVVQTSFLALIFLFLEKIMDMEFMCPENYHGLAVAYSMVFLVVPALIVLAVTCYFRSTETCCTKKKKATNNGKGGQEKESLTGKGKVKAQEGCCCSCCKPCCKTCWKDYKAVLFWLIIVLTDGRYMDCLVNSASAIHTNCTVPLPKCPKPDFIDVVVQISQIIGLLLILVVIFFYCVCKCKSKSGLYAERYEDILLQVTEDTIKQKTKKKQEEYVESQLKEDKKWTGLKIGKSDTLEILEEITSNCKEKVKIKLTGAEVEGDGKGDGKGGAGGAKKGNEQDKQNEQEEQELLMEQEEQKKGEGAGGAGVTKGTEGQPSLDICDTTV
ncbi:uncharacterized protein [Aquarana catesbeiana]|uniref:uncharacterized protein n=1 Tax=Aquarana catesbeiana TaxID=8400 RepID=UPI003CC9F021